VGYVSSDNAYICCNYYAEENATAAKDAVAAATVKPKEQKPALNEVTVASATGVQKPALNASLYPTGCVLCYTCGGSYPYHVATVNSGYTWLEYSSGCSGYLSTTYSDNPYTCCSYTTGADKLQVDEPEKEKKEVEVLPATTKAKVESNASSPLNSCMVCYTCGGSYTVQHATLRTDSWYELGSGCSGSVGYVSSDNAYICCNYYAEENATAVTAAVEAAKVQIMI
jgi:hypothetical protein